MKKNVRKQPREIPQPQLDHVAGGGGDPGSVGPSRPHPDGGHPPGVGPS